MPLTKFDIQFEAISDVYFYENHVGAFVHQNPGQKATTLSDLDISLE